MPTVYLSNPWNRKIKFIVSLETVENGNIEREPWMLVLRPLEPWNLGTTFNTRSGIDKNKTIQQTHKLTRFISPNHKDHQEQIAEQAEKNTNH